MGVYTNMAALAVTPGEQAAAAASAGYPDAAGILSTVVNEIAEARKKLQLLSASIGAGSNKTAIDTAITSLA